MKNILPTCYDYKKFLNEAVLKFDISINEARKKYGLYTYGQWQELLKNNSKWKIQIKKQSFALHGNSSSKQGTPFQSA